MMHWMMQSRVAAHFCCFRVGFFFSFGCEFSYFFSFPIFADWRRIGYKLSLAMFSR